MLAIALLFAIVFGSMAAERKVIVVSIDGLKGTTLASLPGRGWRTPNLNEFVTKGAVAEGLQPVFPTVTYPNHTTIVTGRSSASHGIVGNTIFDPERKLNGAWYYYAEQIRGEALWDAARKNKISTGAVSWPVSVGAAIDFNIPEYRFPRTIDDLMSLRAVSTPGLVQEFEKEFGAVPVTGQTDKLRAQMAAHIVRTRKPDLLFVHLMDWDHAQHGNGPDAPAAVRTLEANDEAIGLIRAEVARAGLAENTVWVITSDHGFWPVSKSFHPHAVLQSIGLGVPEMKAAEWRVAVHGNGGSFGLNAKDPKDVEGIALATQTFRRLQQEGKWGIGAVLEKGELEAAKAYPDSFLAVSMASGFTVGYNSQGSWLRDAGSFKGNHGYLPGPLELDAGLAIFGKGIAAKRLPRGKLVDVAPTVAGLMGFAMREAEGRDLLGALVAGNYPAQWWKAVAKDGAPAWEILPQEAKAGEVILSKRHELGLLSNFAATPFVYRGKRYASLEGFWQMMLYPEDAEDPRAKFAGVSWKYTREQVAQMTAFEAKSAGSLAEANMKKMGIGWVSFEGKRFDYRSATRGEHYRLIEEAMREKLAQNAEVKRVLLATGDLVLRPDHYGEPDSPPEWLYYEVWMKLRAELQKR